MHHHLRLRRAGRPAGRLIVMAALLAAGCQAPAGPARPAAAPATPTADTARERIDALIGTARCQRETDCATLPLPDQACGGPRGWLAFAPAQTDRVALARAVASLPPDPPGMMSTCQVRPDPGAECRAATVTGQPGRCVLRQRGAGEPATTR